MLGKRCSTKSRCSTIQNVAIRTMIVYHKTNTMRRTLSKRKVSRILRPYHLNEVVCQNNTHISHGILLKHQYTLNSKK